MQQRTGSADDDVVAVFLQPIDQRDDLFVVALPDVFPIQDTGKQCFISRKAISFQKFHSLFAFDEIKADAVEIEPDHFFIAVPDIAEVCLQQYFYVTLMRQDFFVKGREQRYIFLRQIGDQARFIELHPLHTLFVEPIEDCDIGICHLVGKIIYCFRAFVFGQLQESESADEDRFRQHTDCFGFFVLDKRLIAHQFNFGIVGQFWNQIMIVGVEPFLHRQGFGVARYALVSARSRKISVALAQTELSVVFRQRVQQDRQIQHVIVI